jgi:hypothetical protein
MSLGIFLSGFFWVTVLVGVGVEGEGVTSQSPRARHVIRSLPKHCQLHRGRVKLIRHTSSAGRARWCCRGACCCD